MKRILIVRLSAIGDIIMTTAIIPALRRAYPDAHVAWLTEEFGASMLASNPDVNECIILPRKALRINQLKHPLTWFRTFSSLRRRLRDGKFDMVIDAQGLLKSAVWAWISGCPRRIGLEPREGAELFYTDSVNPGIDPKGRLCHQYRALNEHLGWPAEPFAMSIVPASEAKDKANARFGQWNNANKPIVLMPFTTRPQKHWFEEKWAGLARLLANTYDHPIAILGGPGDEAASRQIAEAAAPAKVHVVAGPSSDLQEKMGIIQQSLLAIGVDTGLTHMSLALGTPTIALYGSTIPYRVTDPTPGIVLYLDMPCSPCHRHPTCDGAFTCMRDITPESVCDAADKLVRNSNDTRFKAK